MPIALDANARALTFVVHALAIVSVVMVFIWCRSFRGGFAWHTENKSLIFNFHPVLMLMGYIILGGEAIVCYKALPWKKEVNKLIHLILHMIALILAIVGIYSALKYHNEASIPNWYSLHSWIGIAVTCLYAIQWIYGFVIFYFPGGSPELRKGSLPWHVIFGLFLFMLAVFTCTIGFQEKLIFLQSAPPPVAIPKYGTEAYFVHLTAFVIIVYAVFVLLTVASQKNQKIVDDPKGSSKKIEM